MRLRLVVGLGFLATLTSALSCLGAERYSGELHCRREDAEYHSKGDMQGSSTPAALPSTLLQLQTTSLADFNRDQTLGPEYPLAVKGSIESARIVPSGDNERSERGGVAKPHVWTLSGPGWDIHVQLTTWPTEQAVSSLDWAMRWERVTKCLSVEEPDNQDMFEIDELAVQAFWARVWTCYLPYVHGTENI